MKQLLKVDKQQQILPVLYQIRGYSLDKVSSIRFNTFVPSLVEKKTFLNPLNDVTFTDLSNTKIENVAEIKPHSVPKFLLREFGQLFPSIDCSSLNHIIVTQRVSNFLFYVRLRMICLFSTQMLKKNVKNLQAT